MSVSLETNASNTFSLVASIAFSLSSSLFTLVLLVRGGVEMLSTHNYLALLYHLGVYHQISLNSPVLHIFFGSMLIVFARFQISSLWGTFFDTPMKVSLAKFFFGLGLDIPLDWDPITEVNFYKIQ